MSDRDHAVIEAVLADLLALAESPVAVRKAPPAEIKFAPRATTYPVKVEQILKRRDKEKWAALSKWQLDAATEAAEEVVRRNYAAEGFKPIQPRDPRIKLDDGAPSAERNRFDRPLSAYPPGFSADGKYAIVFLSIPWSMHHADGTYLLERDSDTGWRVILRQFVYYV